MNCHIVSAFLLRLYLTEKGFRGKNAVHNIKTPSPILFRYYCIRKIESSLFSGTEKAAEEGAVRA